jgi:hypothetical protein
MGEDAAEAAYPGKGKGKAMGMLAGRLEKTLLPITTWTAMMTRTILITWSESAMEPGGSQWY